MSSIKVDNYIKKLRTKLLNSDPQKDYAFGYDVNEVDEYGNPNVHSRNEVREGNTVKGNYSINFRD